MHSTRIALFRACLGLAAILYVVVFGLSQSPVKAGDEPPDELVPLLDLWSEERKTAPYWGSKGTTPDLVRRVERHQKFMQAGVPLEYRSLRNPYPQAQKVIDAGGTLYTAHCTSCHGSTGSGDGDAANDLAPSPAFLAYLIKHPRSVDEYLLWTISEGGVEFGSKMPTFKETLTEQQIWQIVTYMRADFPAVR